MIAHKAFLEAPAVRGTNHRTSRLPVVLRARAPTPGCPKPDRCNGNRYVYSLTEFKTFKLRHHKTAATNGYQIERRTFCPDLQLLATAQLAWGRRVLMLYRSDYVLRAPGAPSGSATFAVSCHSSAAAR